MKQVTLNIYTINELSEQARERAHGKWVYNKEYHSIDESLDSVNAFLDLFGLQLTDWSLASYGYSYLSYGNIKQDNIRGFKLKDLPTDLTGYYIDYVLLEAFTDAIKESNGNVRYAIKKAVSEATAVIVDDMRWQDSMEYFIEECEANDWYFYEDGTFYGSYEGAA